MTQKVPGVLRPGQDDQRAIRRARVEQTTSPQVISCRAALHSAYAQLIFPLSSNENGVRECSLTETSPALLRLGRPPAIVKETRHDMRCQHGYGPSTATRYS